MLRLASSKKLNAACLWTVAALCLECDAASAAGYKWNEAKSSSAEAIIGKFLEQKPSQGAILPAAISVAIGSGAGLHFAKAWGEARPGTLATPETIYKIGSISKQFTAAAILRLIETARPVSGSPSALTLDTPMSDIFHGENTAEDTERPPITLRSLLTMTASLPNFTRRPPASLDPWGAVPADVLRQSFLQMTQTSWSGSFDYSNTGYFLLSEVIRATAGKGTNQSYGAILQDLVVGRAHLNSTDLSTGEAVQSKLARAHYNRRPAFAQPDWLQGSGDLASSVLDLFKWNTALLGGQVIGKSMLSEMFSDAARVDVWTYYGMGWYIKHMDGFDEYFHSGTVPGYTGFNLVVRKGTGGWHSVSILTNSDGVEGLDDLADRLSELMLTP